MNGECRLKKSNKIPQYADIYLLLNYSTCFGRASHPSSGLHKAVVVASGTDHTIWEASFFKRDHIVVTFEEDPRYPEGFGKLRFPDYVTLAQDGGKVVSLRALAHTPAKPEPGLTPAPDAM